MTMMASSSSATRCCSMLNAAKKSIARQRQLANPRQQPAPKTNLCRNNNVLARLVRENHNHNQLLLAPLSTTTSSPSFLSSSSASVASAAVSEPAGLYYRCRYLSTTSGNDDDKSKTTEQEETSTTEAEATDEASAAESESQQEAGGEGEDASKEEDADPDKKKIADLEAQVTDLKNQLLRSLADQENTRRIAHHDMEKARQLATKGFAKSLLEVWDNLSRALEAAKDHDDSIYQGIEMTQSILQKAFESNGLQKYGEIGDSFDPQVHNALSQYKDPSQTPGSIGQVVKVGFKLHKHVLRPADVMVIAKEE